LNRIAFFILLVVCRVNMSAANHRVLGREVSWQASSSKRSTQKSAGTRWSPCETSV